MCSCCLLPGGRVREPPQPWPIWVLRVVLARVVVLETVRTAGNGPCLSGESLIVEARVCHGPVEIFSGEGFSPKLPVLGYPTCSYVLPG